MREFVTSIHKCIHKAAGVVEGMVRFLASALVQSLDTRQVLKEGLKSQCTGTHIIYTDKLTKSTGKICMLSWYAKDAP